ncbi:MAG: hypothetical protein JST16_05950 [Bdellovibrionales bacterium]|nr:hypothetical protein [Bdellovibrionales bacterium]
MSILKRHFWTAILVSTLGVSAQAQGMLALAWPGCNTKLAMQEFKQNFGVLKPLSDGHAGYARYVGLWVDPSRDLVIAINTVPPTEEKESNDAVSVRFYSLCSSKLLASGRKDLSAGDKDGTLSITMRMNAASMLEFTFSLPKNAKKPNVMNVQVMNRTGSDKDDGPGVLVDQFKVRKF